MPVSISNNDTRKLSFTLRPDDMVYGHVVARQAAEDRLAGMPAEQFLANDRPMAIQKVTLKGAGIESTVQPVEHGAVNPFY